MKKSLSMLAAFALGSGFLLSQTMAQPPATPSAPAKVDGQKAGTNRSEQKGKAGSSTGVSQLATALQLVQYARDNEAPLAMLTAVQMIRQVQVTEDAQRYADHKTEKTPETGTSAPSSGPTKKDETKPHPDALDTTAMLNQAKTWAKDDKAVLPLIEAELAKPAPKPASTMGRVGGPGRIETNVQARSTDTYVIRFRGDEQAVVLVRGDGDTDLDLFIYDENGHEIARDDDLTDLCICRWTPAWTGNFIVKVVNNGRVYNHYVLVTN